MSSLAHMSETTRIKSIKDRFGKKNVLIVVSLPQFATNNRAIVEGVGFGGEQPSNARGKEQ